MDRLVEIALHRRPVGPRGCHQRRAGRTRGREQCLDEAAGLRGIEHDALVGLQSVERSLAGLRQHKAGNRLSDQCGRPGDDRLVVGRNARNQTLAFGRSVRFGERCHAVNVCRLCTQIKSLTLA